MANYNVAASIFMKAGRLLCPAVVLLCGTQAWAGCKDYKVTSSKQIRSDQIKLWVLKDGKVVPNEKPSVLKKEDFGETVNLLDCGDKEYLFWKSPYGPVMVKRLKFTCVEIKSAANPSVLAGSPGSGSSNSSCK